MIKLAENRIISNIKCKMITKKNTQCMSEAIIQGYCTKHYCCIAGISAYSKNRKKWKKDLNIYPCN